MTTALIGSAPVAPVQAEPTLRGEQISQFLFGRVADVIAAQGEWRRIKMRLDGYEGWIHTGYTREVEVAEADAWEAAATGGAKGPSARSATGWCGSLREVACRSTRREDSSSPVAAAASC
jgi:hypothetical protein